MATLVEIMALRLPNKQSGVPVRIFVGYNILNLTIDEKVNSAISSLHFLLGSFEILDSKMSSSFLHVIHDFNNRNIEVVLFI